MVFLSYLASATVALTIAHTATKTAGTPEITHNEKSTMLVGDVTHVVYLIHFADHTLH